MALATRFKSGAPVGRVMSRRRVYSTYQPNLFEVISRDGHTRYAVALWPDPGREHLGEPAHETDRLIRELERLLGVGSLCNCPAQGACWHRLLVLRRRGRSVSIGGRV